MKHLSTFEKRAIKKTKFIEEFDPVRRRRMITQSRSLSGVMPSKKNQTDIWFESALERDFSTHSTWVY